MDAPEGEDHYEGQRSGPPKNNEPWGTPPGSKNKIAGKSRGNYVLALLRLQYRFRDQDTSCRFSCIWFIIKESKISSLRSIP